MKLYLTSSEHERLKGPFECEVISNTYLNKRQVLLVSIDPWLSGIDYGFDLKAIKNLIILAKYKDNDIKLMKHFPIDVVIIVPDNPDNPLEINSKWSEMKIIGWAELYDTLPLINTL